MSRRASLEFRMIRWSVKWLLLFCLLPILLPFWALGYFLGFGVFCSRARRFDLFVGTKCKLRSRRGVFVQSAGEKAVADFLHDHGVRFRYDKRRTIAGEWVRPDFYLPKFGVFVEYLGRAGDKEYDARTVEKVGLFEDVGERVILVRRRDLSRLHDLLSRELGLFLDGEYELTDRSEDHRNWLRKAYHWILAKTVNREEKE